MDQVNFSVSVSATCSFFAIGPAILICTVAVSLASVSLKDNAAVGGGDWQWDDWDWSWTGWWNDEGWWNDDGSEWRSARWQPYPAQAPEQPRPFKAPPASLGPPPPLHPPRVPDGPGSRTVPSKPIPQHPPKKGAAPKAAAAARVEPAKAPAVARTGPPSRVEAARAAPRVEPAKAPAVARAEPAKAAAAARPPVRPRDHEPEGWQSDYIRDLSWEVCLVCR